MGLIGNIRGWDHTPFKSEATADGLLTLTAGYADYLVSGTEDFIGISTAGRVGGDMVRLTFLAARSARNEQSVSTGFAYLHLEEDPTAIAENACFFFQLHTEGSPAVWKLIVPIASGGGNTVEVSPLDLLFRETCNRAFDPSTDLQPESLIELDEPFTDDSLTRFTQTGDGTGTFSIAGGTAQISQTGSANGNDMIQETGFFLNMPQGAVSIDVVSRSGTHGMSGWENSAVGFAFNVSNHIACFYDMVWSSMRIRVVVGGSMTDFPAFGVVLTPPFSIMLTLVGSKLTAWYRPNGGNWTMGPNQDIEAYLNLESTDLTAWKGFFGLYAQAGGTVIYNFDNFKVGRFGFVSIRDLKAVTNEDGTVPLTGSTITLTASCMEPSPYPLGCCGVFTLDLLTKVLTQTGLIMVNRGSKIKHDNAAHIVLDGSGGYYFTITTWGDKYGPYKSLIFILYKHETTLNLLAGANVVSTMVQLSLQGVETGGMAYDPYLVHYAGVWYLAFVTDPEANSNFYPVLNSSSDLSTWTLVGSHPTVYPYEGPVIVITAGAYYMLASSIANTIIYDLDMVYQGKQTILAVSDNAPPHPMIIPYGNFQYCVTFDNTRFAGIFEAVGNLRILRARRYGVDG